MKYKAVKYIVWTVTVLWMAMIFILSAQVASESSETSSSLTEEILQIFPSFNSLTEEEQDTVVSNLQFTVRKLAHFTIYACLGILMYGSVSFIRIKQKKTFAWVFSTFYAVSDEIHQYFVEGRSCELRDIMIDSLGALCGIMIVFAFITLIRHNKNKKSLQ